MKHLTRYALVALVSVALAGCEWGGGGNGNSWNDSNNIANFNGSYTGNGGYLVSDYSVSSSSSATTVTSGGVTYTQYSESGGNTGGNTVLIQGKTLHGSLKAGTLSVFIGSVSLSAHDNGNNTMSGSYVIGPTNISISGHVDYDTGVWSLLLAPPGIAPNQEISQTYQASGGATGSSSPSSDAGGGSGASGVSIYSFNVQQAGNKIKIIDNNGSVYEGQIDTSRTTGNLDANSQGSVFVNGDQVIASFTASGKSASGMYVNMTGNFQGTVSGVSTVTEHSSNNTVVRKTSMAIENRRIMGTWIEDGGKTGSISGVSPSAANVSLGTVVTNG